MRINAKRYEKPSKIFFKSHKNLGTKRKIDFRTDSLTAVDIPKVRKRKILMPINHFDYISSIGSLCKSYSILEAAILLCEIPEEKRATVANESVPLTGTDVQQATYTHPDYPGLEDASRALALAVQYGELPKRAKDGKPVTINLQASEWHVDGRELRAWFEEHLSAWRPAFLFPDADPCAPSDEEKPLAEKERTSLLNLIGALLGTVKGELPEYLVKSNYASEADLIARISKHFDGYPGLSQRTIQQNFAAAKRSLG